MGMDNAGNWKIMKLELTIFDFEVMDMKDTRDWDKIWNALCLRVHKEKTQLAFLGEKKGPTDTFWSFWLAAHPGEPRRTVLEREECSLALVLFSVLLEDPLFQAQHMPGFFFQRWEMKTGFKKN